MAILFADSFDHYNTSQITRKWTSSGTTITSAQSRTGNQSMRLVNNVATTKVLNPADSVFRCAFAVRVNVVGFLVQCQNGDGSQYSFTVNSNWGIDARLGSMTGTVQYSTANGLINQNVWAHVEVYVKVGNSPNGEIKVFINGVEKLSQTGIDTQFQSSSGWTKVFMSADLGTNDWYCDDLVVADGANHPNGSAQGQLGDCRVVLKTATGDGGNTSFTPYTGGSSPHYMEVDDAFPDDDSGYVSSDTVGHIDTYTMADTPYNGNVLGVQTVWCARKTDAGARTLDRVIRLGSTNYAASNPQALATGYDYYMQVDEADPSTGGGTGSWTMAQLNAAEYGVKVG